MNSPSASPYGTAPAAPALGAPTRARNIAVVFTIVLAIITYIDRVCISMAAPAIQKDLGLSAIQMGWAFSVFGWAYAFFEVPGGWLADRLGPRRVLMRIVVWWSFFTAATGWAWSFSSLIVTRTLFGAGEAGAFPNMTRIFTTWLPKAEREKAQATLWLASRWGGALTPLLVAYILQFLSWRRAFEVFGVLGVIWAVAFYRWFRDDPATHPSVNAAELALLPPARETAPVAGPAAVAAAGVEGVSLAAVRAVCVSGVRLVVLRHVAAHLPPQLARHQRQDERAPCRPAVADGRRRVPDLRGADSADRARRSAAWRVRAGSSPSSASSARPASILIFTRIQDPTLAMVVLGFAGLFNDFVMPAAWAGCMDVGGRYAGTLAGSMNMMGSIAGALSPLVVGYLLAWTNQNWTLTFYVSAAIYSIGAVCWIFLDAHTPMEA